MRVLWAWCLLVVVCAGLQPAAGAAAAGVAEAAGVEEPILQQPPEGEEDSVEAEVLEWLRRAEDRPTVEVLGGAASIVRTEDDDGEDVGERKGRSQDVTLGERVAAFLRSHALRLQLPGAQGDAEEGRGRLKRLLLPFIVLLKLLMVTVVFPAFTSGIALLALKGLWAGLAGGLVAGAVALSELVAKAGWAPPRVTLLRPQLQVPVEHVYHSPVDLLHHGWSRTTGAAAGAGAAGGAAAAADPYRGYGPSAPAAPAAPVPVTTWHLRPVGP